MANERFLSQTGYRQVSSLSGYVPYTGASLNVNLGVHDITAHQFIGPLNGNATTADKVNHDLSTGNGLTGGPFNGSSAVTISVSDSSANSLAGYDNSGVFSDVIIGSGITLAGGVLSATGSGGTVTSVATGTGLTGGPITGSGTISVANSSSNTLAGYDSSGIFSDVTIGTGLSLSSGILSVTSVSFTWNEVTGATQTVNNNGYVANNSSLVLLNLPLSSSFSDKIRIAGKGAGGWMITQNAGQTIHFGDQVTTTGTGGSIASQSFNDVIELLCTTANTDFTVLSCIGNLTIV